MILDKEFIGIDDARKIVGFTPSKTREVLGEFGVATKIIPKSKKILYYKKDVEKYKEELDAFWDSHIVHRDAVKKFGKRTANLAKIEIPTIYRKTSARYVVSLNKVNELQKSYKEDYIIYADAMEFLDLTEINFANVIKEFNLISERVSRDNNAWFKKEDIYKIKKQQEEFLKNAYTYEYVYNVYGPSYTTDYLDSYPLPSYARCRKIFFNKTVYYKKSEVELQEQKNTQKEQSLNIKEDTLFNTFLSRLKVSRFNGFKDRPYSSEKWKGYVALKLKNTNGSDENGDRKVSYFVRTSEMLFDFLDKNNKKEVYSLSTNEINLLLNTASAQSSPLRNILYHFFKEVAGDMLYLNLTSNSRGFDFNKVKRYPNKKSRTNVEDLQEEELFTFLEYREIFIFLNDIDFHLSRLAKIDDSFNKTRYLSIWLYLSLQLTNTWRTGDICDFPRLNWEYILTSQNINNIDWFYNNRISKETGRLVVSTLNQYNFTISKTGEKMTFRASDEVCQLFATILLLLDLNYKNQTVIENYKDDKIMCFGTKYNKPQQGTIDRFFKGLNLPNFKFTNKKMTKSIMSFSKLISPAEYGILIPKNQRGHKAMGSTLHYVKMPKEQMDFLSEQLFERGEFGHLYDALVGMIIGNKSRDEYMKERTELIKTMQSTFGDINKLESTLRLSNFHTQTEVVDMLYSLGLEECNKKLNDIYFNNLPSKEEHIQCLFGLDGCKYPERDSYPTGEGCITCEYSIPNIYAITVLSTKLKEDLKAYASTSDRIIKRKLSMRISKYKKVIKVAIEKYGKEYIYSCLGLDMTRDEFLRSVRKIQSPSQVVKSPIERLLGGSK